MLDKDKRVSNLKAANARKTSAARDAALQALEQLASRAAPVNIHAVAAAAGVSRGFIYSQPELRAQIVAMSKRSGSKVRSTGRRPNEASLAARLETALDTIADLKSENRQLKQRVENLTAQLYDQAISR